MSCSRVKPASRRPLLSARCPAPLAQRGAALIMAIFLIVGLAALGALASRLLVMGSTESINAWYSAQALYAAESGVDLAARDLRSGGGGNVIDAVVRADQAWVSTQVTRVDIGGRTLYTITSTGAAGGRPGAPRSRRRIVVQFMP